MALAESQHHTSRGQKKARAGEEESEMKHTAKFRTTPPPQPELFSLEEEPCGGLPAPLSAVAGRQDKVVQHVLEDLGSVCPVVQILDLPVPHRMDHLAELLNLEEDVLDAGRLVDRDFRFQNWLSKCPRSASTSSLSAPWFLSRSWRNSWWKYLRSCHFPWYSGLLSRPWTFQFRVVTELFILHRHLPFCR